jgi:hypothetical protein
MPEIRPPFKHELRQLLAVTSVIDAHANLPTQGPRRPALGTNRSFRGPRVSQGAEPDLRDPAIARFGSPVALWSAREGYFDFRMLLQLAITLDTHS